MKRSTTPSGKRKRLTPRQLVLKEYPDAACIEVSGCTVAVFKNGVIYSADLLAMAHTRPAAWAEAARKL